MTNPFGALTLTPTMPEAVMATPSGLPVWFTIVPGRPKAAAGETAGSGAAANGAATGAGDDPPQPDRAAAMTAPAARGAARRRGGATRREGGTGRRRWGTPGNPRWTGMPTTGGRWAGRVSPGGAALLAALGGKIGEEPHPVGIVDGGELAGVLDLGAGQDALDRHLELLPRPGVG